MMDELLSAYEAWRAGAITWREYQRIARLLLPITERAEAAPTCDMRTLHHFAAKQDDPATAIELARRAARGR